MVNQNPYIEEEQITQWPNEKIAKEQTRSSKHTHKTKDRATRNYKMISKIIINNSLYQLIIILLDSNRFHFELYNT